MGVANSIEERAKAIYQSEVLSCDSGMMPEWHQLDAQGKALWLDRAQEELGDFIAGQSYACDGQVYSMRKAHNVPNILPSTYDRREREVLVKACIVRAQQLYADERGKGVSWDDLPMGNQLQWVALAQAEFLSIHATMTPRQFLQHCGEDTSWQ